MKPGKFTHTIAVVLSSISSLFASMGLAKSEPVKVKFSKKSERSSDDRFANLTSLALTPGQLAGKSPELGQRFPWKRDIVPNRRRLFHGLMRHIRGRLCRLAKVAGSPSAMEIEWPTRNGKTLGLFGPITGNMGLATNAPNRISTKAQASMCRLRYA